VEIFKLKKILSDTGRGVKGLKRRITVPSFSAFLFTVWILDTEDCNRKG
jgi:hypothetical protein